MEGWIKLHRKMINWEWYQDKNVKELFVHLLLTVNHKDQKWQGIEIKRGQRLTSLEHLSKEINLSIMQIRTALNKLKSTNEITVKTTNKYTIITIVKYDNYQYQDAFDNIQNNIQINNQITNKQQTNNNQITTNNNDNNINNEKNEKNNIAEIDRIFIETLGSTNINNIRECIDYLNKLPLDVIEYALKKTGRKGAKWDYARTILDSYVEKGLNNIEKVYADEIEFKNRVEGNKQSNKIDIEERNREFLAKVSEKNDTK